MSKRFLIFPDHDERYDEGSLIAHLVHRADYAATPNHWDLTDNYGKAIQIARKAVQTFGGKIVVYDDIKGKIVANVTKKQDPLVDETLRSFGDMDQDDRDNVFDKTLTVLDLEHWANNIVYRAYHVNGSTVNLKTLSVANAILEEINDWKNGE